jgi:hypothetical protein
MLRSVGWLSTDVSGPFKMAPTDSPQTSVLNIPEDNRIHVNCSEILRSRNCICVLRKRGNYCVLYMLCAKHDKRHWMAGNSAR